jgi:hypothetical protein
MLFRLIHALDISSDQIFRPDSAPLAKELDQIIHELQACSTEEQQIVIPTVRSLIRALQQKEPEQQA